MCDKKEKQLELDKRYLRMAAVWAENSYCKRRQVGALIVKDRTNADYQAVIKSVF